MIILMSNLITAKKKKRFVLFHFNFLESAFHRRLASSCHFSVGCLFCMLCFELLDGRVARDLLEFFLRVADR